MDGTNFLTQHFVSSHPASEEGAVKLFYPNAGTLIFRPFLFGCTKSCQGALKTSHDGRVQNQPLLETEDLLLVLSNPDNDGI
jgi:hypothetical protein